VAQHLSTLTVVHVLISLVGIASGLVVVCGLLTSRRVEGWTQLFLATTIATSVTGFFFPFHGFTPAIGVGILSLVVLTVAIFARYSFRLENSWRWIYAAAALTALYFNVFVLIVQSFQKIAALKALAPTQTEPPFLIAQAAALLIFLALGAGAVRRFRPPGHT
jgi:hypothetical protein